MLASILILYQKIVIIPNNSKLLNSYIMDDIKYFSCFKNYLRVLDNIHFLVYLPATIGPPY